MGAAERPAVFAFTFGDGALRELLYDAATDVATLLSTLTGTDVRPFSGCTEKKPLEGNERLQISNLFLPPSVTEELGKRMNQSHRSEGRVPQRVKRPQRESLSVTGLRV
jgi:hypothetical protein